MRAAMFQCTIAIAVGLATFGSTAHAERTVKGKVMRDGKPLAGARVRVYDSDFPSGDELMGEDTTGSDGKYSIGYRPGTWDGPKVGTAWRPDIFVVAALKVSGDWVRVAESGKRDNHKVADDLSINLTAQSALQTGIPGEQCPAGPEFESTSDKWRGCKCPAGYYKRWLDVTKWKARCAKGDSPRASCEAEGGVWGGSDNTHGACVNKEALANTLQSGNPAVVLYHLFFKSIGAGVTTRKLHPSVVSKYDASYDSPLSEVEIGVSPALEATNAAMTNCHTIYFPPSGASAVKAAVEGSALSASDADWLFHELAHTQQCTNKGGVNNYAADWFAQLGTTVTAELADDPGRVSAKLIHNAMPMEDKADQKASEMCAATKLCPP